MPDQIQLTCIHAILYHWKNEIGSTIVRNNGKFESTGR